MLGLWFDVACGYILGNSAVRIAGAIGEDAEIRRQAKAQKPAEVAAAEFKASCLRIIKAVGVVVFIVGGLCLLPILETWQPG